MASIVDPSSYSQITGNAPEPIKEAALTWYKLMQGRTIIGFGHHVRRKLRIIEVSVEPSPDDPQAECTKMVCEIEIGPGQCALYYVCIQGFVPTVARYPEMCDAQGVLNRGCMIFLMDECVLHLRVLNVSIPND